MVLSSGYHRVDFFPKVILGWETGKQSLRSVSFLDRSWVLLLEVTLTKKYSFSLSGTPFSSTIDLIDTFGSYPFHRTFIRTLKGIKMFPGIKECRTRRGCGVY